MTTTRVPVSAQAHDCVLLVVSCDAYADLWQPYFTLLYRHWTDCPFPVFLGAGDLRYDDSNITTLHSAGGRDWSRCALDYLQSITTGYVLVMLDDFFLRKPVDTTVILRCLDFAKARNACQVRLIPRPGPTDYLQGERLIGECVPGLPYRLSTQAAIWDRSKLIELLRCGETIWEFERNGNQRAQAIPHGFYSVWRSVLPYDGILAHHVVEKGYWFAHEKWIFSRQNIGCDFSRRRVLPWRPTLIYHMANVLDRVLDVFPWQVKKRIKSSLRWLLMKQFEATLARLRAPT